MFGSPITGSHGRALWRGYTLNWVRIGRIGCSVVRRGQTEFGRVEGAHKRTKLRYGSPLGF